MKFILILYKNLFSIKYNYQFSKNICFDLILNINQIRISIGIFFELIKIVVEYIIWLFV